MSTSNTLLVPRIESRIQVIRGLRVMIDVDLAELYGVQTKRLNEQVKRNRERSPSDFLFQLTFDEKTEHEAIQAANVLALGQSAKTGIHVLRARAAWPST